MPAPAGNASNGYRQRLSLAGFCCMCCQAGSSASDTTGYWRLAARKRSWPHAAQRWKCRRRTRPSSKPCKHSCSGWRKSILAAALAARQACCKSWASLRPGAANVAPPGRRHEATFVCNAKTASEQAGKALVDNGKTVNTMGWLGRKCRAVANGTLA